MQIQGPDRLKVPIANTTSLSGASSPIPSSPSSLSSLSSASVRAPEETGGGQELGFHGPTHHQDQEQLKCHEEDLADLLGFLDEQL